MIRSVPAIVDWRLVFLINVPVGIFGTVWSYWMLREQGERVHASIDWKGNLLFAGGLGALLIGVTYGIRPYSGHAMGWTKPVCADDDHRRAAQLDRNLGWRR